MSTQATQIQQLRRQVCGLSLQALSQRADLPYQRVWRCLSGGATFTPPQAAKIDQALTISEAEMAAAVAALAVLRGSFAADSDPEGEVDRPAGHHGPRRPLSPSLVQRASRLRRLAENSGRQVA